MVRASSERIARSLARLDLDLDPAILNVVRVHVVVERLLDGSRPAIDLVAHHRLVLAPPPSSCKSFEIWNWVYYHQQFNPEFCFLSIGLRITHCVCGPSWRLLQRAAT